MTSPAKIAANRRNAQLSTGPRSHTGKALVAQNAIRHGIFANLPVVTGESDEDWQAHREGVVASVAPVGLLEVSLAERVALLLWRLARLARYEARTISADVEDAGLLPQDFDPTPYAAFRSHNRENHLKATEQALRRAREDLAEMAPTAHLLRRIRHDDGIDALPSDVVLSILCAAYELVVECPLHRFKPDHPKTPAFEARFKLPGAGPESPRWTKEAFLRTIAYFAEAVGLTDADFRIELQDVLDSEAARFVRTIERLESDRAALIRRYETENARSAASALLPPDHVTDRVAKYERHLHNLLASTLHELERLQARRGGARIVPPLVADIQVQINGTDLQE